MQGVFPQIAIIGVIGVLAFLVLIEAFCIWKSKKRISVLEEALGPKGIYSIDEAKLESRMRKEIVASLEWLKRLQHQIPTMKKATLETIRKELTDAHEMYLGVFGKDLIEKSTDQSGLELKQALLLQIEITIGWVEKALAGKSS
jgi:hypothetical protein